MERFYFVIFCLAFHNEAYLSNATTMKSSIPRSTTQIVCRKPDIPSNGTISPAKEKYNFGDTVTYTCNQGYNVTEPSSRSCNASDKWTKQTPTCYSIELPYNGLCYGDGQRDQCKTTGTICKEQICTCEFPDSIYVQSSDSCQTKNDSAVQVNGKSTNTISFEITKGNEPDVSVSVQCNKTETQTAYFFNSKAFVNITDLQTQSLYSCIVTTVFANNKTSGSLTKLAWTSPGKMPTVRVERTLDTTALLYWFSELNCKTMSVEFRAQDSAGNNIVLENMTYSSQTGRCFVDVTGLTPSTTYKLQFFMVANNISGESSAVSLKTGAESPNNCSFVGRTNSSIDLFWISGRGNFDVFRIRRVNVNPKINFLDVSEGKTDYTYPDDGLDPKTFYKYVIQVRSTSGYSDNSCSIETCTLPSDPSVLRFEEIKSNLLIATWSSVDNQTGVYYQVTITALDGTKNLTSTYNTTTGHISNLTDATWYIVEVVAVFKCEKDEIIRSSGNVSSTFTTRPLPSQEEIKVTHVNEEGFTVEWNGDWNINFEHYSLDLIPDFNNSYTNITIDKNTTSFSFSELLQGIRYMVNMYTVFCGLRSEYPIYVSTFTAPHHNALAISKPTGQNLRSNGFHVSWNTARENFTSWHVIVLDINNSTVFNKTLNQFAQGIDITTLTSGTQYTLEVYTSVPGFISLNFTKYGLFTRPSDVQSATIDPLTVHESNVTIVINVADDRFTELQISIDPQPSCDSEQYIIDYYRTTKTITGLNPATNYTFIISSFLQNGSLNSTSAYYVSSYTGPVPPTDVSVIHVETDSIQLNVSHDNTRFDQYQIDNSNGTSKLYPNDSVINIDTLTPGTLYNLKIYTLLENIRSDRYYTVPEMNTKPDQVTHITLDVDSLTNSSMTVTWSRPVIGQADLYITIFTCTSPNENSDMQPEQTYADNKTTSSATHLDPGTQCTVHVTSQLNGQTGATTDKAIDTKTNEEAPGKVSISHLQAQTSQDIGITWTKPSLRNGVIRSYTLTIENGECTTTPVLTCANYAELPEINEEDTNVDGSINLHACSSLTSKAYIIGQASFNCAVSGLHPYRNYSVSMFAFTTKIGPEETSVIQTLEDLPGKPLNLAMSRKLHDEISLQWMPPVERNGHITHYTITYTYNKHSCTGGHNGTGGTIEISVRPTLDASTSFDINGNVYPYWDYNISVSANTSIGQGEESLTIHVVTDEYIPGIISDASVTVNNITSESATFQWDQPCYANGVIIGYNICIENQNKQNIQSTIFCHATNDTKVSLSLTSGILLYRQYHVTVAAATAIGSGYHTNGRQFNTPTSKPTKPDHISENQTATTILVSWSRLEPETFTGPTKYIATATDAVNSSLIYSCTTSLGTWIDNLSNNCTVSNLEEYWDYNIQVQVLTKKDKDNWYTERSSVTVAKTVEASPGPVRNIFFKPETDATKPRSITLTWEHPTKRDLNGILTSFYIQYLTYVWKVGNDSMSLFMTNIQAGDYNISVCASTSAGNGTKRFKAVTVQSGAPIKQSETGSFRLVQRSSGPVSNSEKRISVVLPISKFLCNNSNGEPTRWGVVVSEASEAKDASFVGTRDAFDTKIKNVYKSWFDEKESDSIHPYVATPKYWYPCSTGHRRNRSTGQSLNFKVGASGECSGKSHSDYCNGQLAPGRSYQVKAFVCTTGGCTETKYSEPIKTAKNLNLPIGLGAGAAAFVISVVVVVVIFMKRRQAACFAKDSEQENNRRPGQSMTEMKETTAAKSTHRVNGFFTGPVRLTEFQNYFERLHKYSGLLFADAYKMLGDESPKHPTTAAEAQNCRPKNRYTSILPFDHSRVKLLPFDDEEGSDYINANFVSGYTSKTEYIATQGPMIPTKDDFWRIVWEQNVDTIVMLTKLMEKGRQTCDKYWPELNEPLYCRNMAITTESELNKPDFTMRTITLKVKQEVRKVSQFCCIKWPDSGCPGTTALLLDFVKAVRQHSPYGKRQNTPRPLIVHCCAGVGRTGTFIAVDHLLQHIRDHDDVDIYKLVLTMRNQRCNMVQTKEQYVYIHECIRDVMALHTDCTESDGHVYEHILATPDHVYDELKFKRY